MQRSSLIGFIVLSMTLQNAFSDEQVDSSQVRERVNNVIANAFS